MQKLTKIARMCQRSGKPRQFTPRQLINSIQSIRMTFNRAHHLLRFVVFLRADTLFCGRCCAFSLRFLFDFVMLPRVVEIDMRCFHFVAPQSCVYHGCVAYPWFGSYSFAVSFTQNQTHSSCHSVGPPLALSLSLCLRPATVVGLLRACFIASATSTIFMKSKQPRVIAYFKDKCSCFARARCNSFGCEASTN